MVYTSFLFKCHTLSHHSQNGAFPGDWSGAMRSGSAPGDPLHILQMSDLFVSPFFSFCSTRSISHVVYIPLSRPYLPFPAISCYPVGIFSPSHQKLIYGQIKKPRRSKTDLYYLSYNVRAFCLARLHFWNVYLLQVCTHMRTRYNDIKLIAIIIYILLIIVKHKFLFFLLPVLQSGRSKKGSQKKRHFPFAIPLGIVFFL